jgi:hypothetical protein
MKNFGKFALLYALLRLPPSWILIVLASFILAPVFLFQGISKELKVLTPYIQQQIELYGGSDAGSSRTR